MNLLYTLSKQLIRAKVLARPSKKIKSPYLADVLLFDTNKEVLCHSTALGCSDHIKKGTIVWVLEKEATFAQSTHVIYLIEENEIFIGCNPSIANTIAYSLLKLNYVISNIASLISEYTIGDSRFDFIGYSENKIALIEVKSVCIADCIDGTSSEVEYSIKRNPNPTEKIAIFPYCTVAGKRKLSKEPLSERALKHVTELTKLVNSNICILLFVVQRADVSQFCVTKLDPIYKDACKKALDEGVIIKAISVRWDTCHCYYEKELEILW